MSRQTRGAASAARADVGSKQLSRGAATAAQHGVAEDEADDAGWPAQGMSDDASRLEALYRRHASWLAAALRRRFGGEAAEDLLQETFLRAASSPQTGAVRRPGAWLLAIAVNAARDLHRRRRVRPAASPGDDAQVLERVAAAPEQDEILLLKQIIMSLPSHLREVLLLSRFGGLTNEEIGRRLGISVKTVEWRMTKALATCTARLRD